MSAAPCCPRSAVGQRRMEVWSAFTHRSSEMICFFGVDRVGVMFMLRDLRGVCTPPKKTHKQEAKNAADIGTILERPGTIRDSRRLLLTSRGTERKPHNSRRELHGKKEKRKNPDSVRPGWEVYSSRTAATTATAAEAKQQNSKAAQQQSSSSIRTEAAAKQQLLLLLLRCCCSAAALLLCCCAAFE